MRAHTIDHSSRLAVLAAGTGRRGCPAGRLQFDGQPARRLYDDNNEEQPDDEWRSGADDGDQRGEHHCVHRDR